MEFQRTFSGAPWESKVGYCRAIRAGDHIYVTGTAPVDEHGDTFAPGDAYTQTKRCLEIIQRALQDLDADTDCVVRTRMFVTDISRWQEYGQAHGEFFADSSASDNDGRGQSIDRPRYAGGDRSGRRLSGPDELKSPDHTIKRCYPEHDQHNPGDSVNPNQRDIFNSRLQQNDASRSAATTIVLNH